MLSSNLSDQDELDQLQDLLIHLSDRLDRLPARYRKAISEDIEKIQAFLKDAPLYKEGGALVFQESPGLDGAVLQIDRNAARALAPAESPASVEDSAGANVGSSSGQHAENFPAFSQFDLLQAIFQANPGGLAVVTVPDMVCRVTNQAYRAILPDPAVDPVGKRMDQFWPENDAARAREIFGQVVASGEGVDGRYQQNGTDEAGRENPRWFSVRVEPIEWHAQPAVLVVLWETTPLEQALQEIKSQDEHLRAQKERLRAAGERLSEVLESITDMYFALDREWRFLEVNSHAERYVFLRPASELIGKVYFEVYPQTVGSIFVEKYQEAMRENHPVHFEARSLLLGRWIEIHVYPRKDRLEIYGRDITDRKQAEDALKLSDSRFRVALASLNIIVFSMDRDLRYTWVYSPAEDFSDADYLGKRDDDFIPAEDARELIEMKQSVIETGRPLRRENRLLRNGRWRTFLLTLDPVFEEETGRDAEARQESRGRRGYAESDAETRRRGDAEKEGDGETLGRGDAEKESSLAEGAEAASSSSPRHRVSPSPRHSPKVVGLTGSALDITEQRRLEAEQREFLTQMEVQRRLSEHRETERQNIAREIHDGPIQSLAATLFHLQRVKEDVVRTRDAEARQESRGGRGDTETEKEIRGEGESANLSFELEQVTQSLKGTVQELRGVVNDLRPPSLLQFGLARVIQIHAEDLREHFPQLDITLDLFDDRYLLSKQVCLELYRVFQESLHNVIRHAQAGQVGVRYALEDQQLVLEVKDNGVGFALPEDWVFFTRSNRFGIVGMRERIEAMGGEFEIRPVVGKGTTVRIKVPVGGRGDTGTR